VWPHVRFVRANGGKERFDAEASNLIALAISAETLDSSGF
jgi:hypothetical protein